MFHCASDWQLVLGRPLYGVSLARAQPLSAANANRRPPQQLTPRRTFDRMSVGHGGPGRCWPGPGARAVTLTFTVGHRVRRGTFMFKLRNLDDELQLFGDKPATVAESQNLGLPVQIQHWHGHWHTSDSD